MENPHPPPVETPPAGGETAPAQKPKLDLSRLGKPERLEEVTLEDITIDGICGVY